jgi:hypothetical protein
MPRRALALLLIVLLAGCGAVGAAAPAPRPQHDAAKDTAAVQARVSAYVKHMLAGDGAGACAQFTPEYRHDADARGTAGGIGTCAEVISFYGEAVTDSLPESFSAMAGDPQRVIVTLTGDRAQAAMRSPDGGPSIKQATLRRVGSRWLIDSLGVTRPRER